MRRKQILLGILILLCAVALVRCDRSATERESHWKELLEKDIPVGTPKEKILTWGKTHSLTLTPLPRNRLFTALEKVPVKGLAFPCSEWNLFLEITLGPDNRSTDQKVIRIGSCL